MTDEDKIVRAVMDELQQTWEDDMALGKRSTQLQALVLLLVRRGVLK